MSSTPDGAPLPRRRDVRTGAADPAPPTGMIPVVPLVASPSGDPLPTRRELRTGLIQVVPPAAGQAGSTTRYVARAETRPADTARKGRGTAWAVSTLAVLAAAATALWFAFLR